MFSSFGFSLFQAVPIESSPLILAVIALLGVPGVTSFITGIFKSVGGSVPPETLVYIASLVLTGAVVVMGHDSLPGFDLLNPAGSVLAWQVWAKVNASNAQVVYDLLKRVLKLIPSS